MFKKRIKDYLSLRRRPVREAVLEGDDSVEQLATRRVTSRIVLC